MQLPSKLQLQVKQVRFGSGSPLTCIPIVPKTEQQFHQQLAVAVDKGPDIIEWRVDFYEKADQPEACAELLRQEGPSLRDIPLILTFRHQAEGGAVAYTRETRAATICACLETGFVNLVDVETLNPKDWIKAVGRAAHSQEAQLILSHHNFAQTPDEDFMIEKLCEAQRLGADIAKLAVMPQTFDDVLSLMRATYRARKDHVSCPMITMSMGELGKISRVIAGLYGSDMTFVVGEASSAPGQIPIDALKQLWQLLA